MQCVIDVRVGARVVSVKGHAAVRYEKFLEIIGPLDQWEYRAIRRLIRIDPIEYAGGLWDPIRVEIEQDGFLLAFVRIR